MTVAKVHYLPWYREIRWVETIEVSEVPKKSKTEVTVTMRMGFLSKDSCGRGVLQ